MIRVRARVHDKFSLEFKVWFEKNMLPDSGKETDYRLESWIFLPASLDVNALTYSREQFYSAIKSYYRTITPVYLLEDLAIAKIGSPLEFLSNAVFNIIGHRSKSNLSEYEYQIKMYCAIFKSAIREKYNILKKEPTPQLLSDFSSSVYAVLRSYGSLSGKIKEDTDEKLYPLFSLGEEFLINLTELYVYKVYNITGEKIESLKKIEEYKLERGYKILTRDGGLANSNIIYRWSVLKKYIESDLFLSVDKRKDGVLTEQVYYSIAAGLSMIFATVVSFSFQQKYGNFTIPFFIALVISYMLKDRIKELIRYAFTTNRKLKYFDNKIKLAVKETEIGESKEGFDIVPQSKVPQKIMETRNRSYMGEMENRISQENVLFYRNLIKLDRKKLSLTSNYKIDGVNEIIFFNLMDYVKKMDNPQNPYFITEGKTVSEILVDRVYYINFIFQLSCSDGSYVKRYRIMLNRNGILNLEEIE
ncbi:MAG: hypothetical protein RR919_00875 [Bacteroidales bacterium]